MSVSARIRLMAGLLLLLFAGLVFFGLWKFGTISGFFLVYALVISRVVGFGLNPHLANILAIGIAALIYFVIYGQVYKRNRNWGYACFLGIMIIQSLFMFLGERDRYFSLADGQAIKYYTINPLNQQIQVFDQPIYDAFGQKAEPVSYKIAQDIYRQKQNGDAPDQEIPFDKIKFFFDRRTGKPLVYYYYSVSTGYHFYSSGGFDSTFGTKLEPVTKRAVWEARQAHEKQR